MNRVLVFKLRFCGVFFFLTKRNAMCMIFLQQQILSDKLLLVIMGEQKINLSYRFKLEPITTYFL